MFVWLFIGLFVELFMLDAMFECDGDVWRALYNDVRVCVCVCGMDVCMVEMCFQYQNQVLDACRR
jgi:hypothetical protein